MRVAQMAHEHGDESVAVRTANACVDRVGDGARWLILVAGLVIIGFAAPGLWAWLRRLR